MWAHLPSHPNRTYEGSQVHTAAACKALEMTICSNEKEPNRGAELMSKARNGLANGYHVLWQRMNTARCKVVQHE